MQGQRRANGIFRLSHRHDLQGSRHFTPADGVLADFFVNQLEGKAANLAQAFLNLGQILNAWDLQQDAVEARLYGNINQRIAKSNEQQLDMFLGRLKGYLAVACLIWLLISTLLIIVKL